MKKAEFTQKLLEILSDGAIATAALFATIATSKYGSSSSRVEREFWSNVEKIESLIHDPVELKKERRNFYSMISKLKKDGLIEKTDNKWLITTKGKKWLREALGLKKKEYKPEKGTLKIVIFDIPEKLRKRRDWLRSVLRELGFEMLQKSVWIGKVKIPQEFIMDLQTAEIVDYVDIFEITKTGSLHQI